MNDTWTFSGGVWQNITSTSGPAPTARYGMAMTYDAADHYVLAFGGTASSGTVNDTWSFVSGKWHQVTVSGSPPPLFWPEMVYDAASSYVLLFDGGYAETYTYRAGDWSNLPINTTGTPPSERQGFGLAYDATDGYVLLFGGWNPRGYVLGDTWTFSAGVWTNVTSTLASSPSARASPQMTFDDTTGQVILFGGYAWPFANLNDTWSFTDGSWTNLSQRLSPPGRYGGAMVNDSADGGVVLFSGDDQLGSGGALNETWMLSASPPMSGLKIVVIPSTPLPAETVTFGSSFVGGVAPFTYSWNFGDGGKSTSTSPTHQYAAIGYYNVALWVNDSAGHSANADLRLHVYVPLTITTLDATPNPASLGQPVNFTASATGGTPPYTYSWSFGDGGIGGNLSTITHIYTTNGPFQTEVTVRDSVGGIAQSYLNVSIALEALAESTGPTGASRLIVSFVGQAQGGVPPYSFRWNFGDGTPTSEIQDPTHAYESSGKYAVVLTVTDAKGSQSTSSLTVQVGTPSTGGPSPYSWVYAVVILSIAVGGLATVWGVDRYLRRSQLEEGNRWVEELTQGEEAPSRPPTS